MQGFTSQEYMDLQSQECGDLQAKNTWIYKAKNAGIYKPRILRFTIKLTPELWIL